MFIGDGARDGPLILFTGREAVLHLFGCRQPHMHGAICVIIARPPIRGPEYTIHGATRSSLDRPERQGVRPHTCFCLRLRLIQEASLPKYTLLRSPLPRNDTGSHPIRGTLRLYSHEAYAGGSQRGSLRSSSVSSPRYGLCYSHALWVRHSSLRRVGMICVFACYMLPWFKNLLFLP